MHTIYRGCPEERFQFRRCKLRRRFTSKNCALANALFGPLRKRIFNPLKDCITPLSSSSLGIQSSFPLVVCDFLEVAGRVVSPWGSIRTCCICTALSAVVKTRQLAMKANSARRGKKLFCMILRT